MECFYIYNNNVSFPEYKWSDLFFLISTTFEKLKGNGIEKDPM